MWFQGFLLEVVFILSSDIFGILLPRIISSTVGDLTMSYDLFAQMMTYKTTYKLFY